MQRLFDILFALVALTLLCPFLLSICIILKFSGEGQIIFKQERLGFRGEKIKIYKFATMVKNSPSIGAGTLTMANDPRVLPVGKFLRKAKINELPQLVNILLGDISLVGPRPLVLEGEELYGKKGSKVIRSVKPGATGVGSLVLRDEEIYYARRTDAPEFYKSVISPYKYKLEEWYIQRQSFLLNIKILALTAVAIAWPSFSPWKFLPDLPRMPKEMINEKLRG